MLASCCCLLAAFTPPALVPSAPLLTSRASSFTMQQPPETSRPAWLPRVLGKAPEKLEGRVVPTRRSTAAADDEEGELSIKELLSRYGVIALLFHFTVWSTCLVTVFTALSLGGESLLPDWLSGAAEGEGAAAAAGAAGKIAATLAVVEAVGPARLALTVAATPKVSERAREYQAVRDLEAWAATMVAKVSGGEAQ